MGMMLRSLKNLFSRPYTTRYPEAKADLPPENRGRVEWNMDDCIFCMLCQKNCPTLAIKTDKAAKSQAITRNRCMACSRCVEVCPKKCIRMVPDYSAPTAVPEVHTYAVGMVKWGYEVDRLEIKRHEKR
jgi:formate hydrogenlyase subunit 6/NADH:ubiquinone oxidoreductase subunit I